MILIDWLPAVNDNQVNSVGIINVLDYLLDKPILINANSTDWKEVPSLDVVSAK